MKYSRQFSKQEKNYMYGQHVYISNIRKRYSGIIETFEEYCERCFYHTEFRRLACYLIDDGI